LRSMAYQMAVSNADIREMLVNSLQEDRHLTWTMTKPSGTKSSNEVSLK
jgi:hypothetical protein